MSGHKNVFKIDWLYDDTLNLYLNEKHIGNYSPYGDRSCAANKIQDLIIKIAYVLGAELEVTK